MERKTEVRNTKAGVIGLLETAQERVELLKAGLTGKEIESRYLQCCGLEPVGVNWQEA